MSLTDRDRKIVLALVPVVLVLAYWFLVLAPKRSESKSLATQLTRVEGKRDEAVARADQLEGARSSYAKDYETVVRLGKAIPASVDMPSLLVQLDEAARGTHIRFGKVAAGARNEAPAPPAPAAAAGSSAGSTPTPAAAPGGAAAQTGPGQTAEKAGNAAQTSDQASAGAGADAPPAPSGGASASAPASAGAPGLESVPLTFSFSGGFFDLTDFFHEMKRFVYVANERVRVEGRLLTIDGFSFESTAFPTIKAEVQTTVYLSPKAEGTTAGGKPSGPAPATTQTAATSSPSPPAPTPVPASSEGTQ